MPAQIYERSDVSEGTASEANPEANHRCEGEWFYCGVERWQGFPREKRCPSTGNKILGGVWSCSGVLPFNPLSSHLWRVERSELGQRLFRADGRRE